MKTRWVWIIGLFIVVGVGLGADEKVDKVPKEVQQAEKTLTKWLDGFKGQTAEQIRKSLGAPTKETTWTFENKEEPVLKYKIAATTELSLYFYDDKVVQTGLHLLPK